MSEFFRRLAYYFRRPQFERDLDEEMQHHAELAGRAKFGNVTRWKEESRAMWGCSSLPASLRTFPRGAQ